MRISAPAKTNWGGVIPPVPFAPCTKDQQDRMAYNGPRVYEPARRAQAVASLPFSNRRERRAGCRRPSTRRVRRVNPLLHDVAGPAIFPRFATDGKAGIIYLEYLNIPVY